MGRLILVMFVSHDHLGFDPSDQSPKEDVGRGEKEYARLNI